MLFSSAIFLFLFLPVVVGIYFILPKKLRNAWLLLSSIVFYTWGEKQVVLVMLASAVIDYSSGLIISKGHKRTGLLLSLTFNLAALGYFKYLNFTADNMYHLFQWVGIENQYLKSIPEVTLPIGISFYTFQTMSYTIDVYRGKVKANKNFIQFATYVTMFPQLVAGPIVRYIDIQKQLAHRVITYNKITAGIERFIIGLAKKMIIANNCAYIADGIFALPPEHVPALTAWLGVIAYSFQIYFDFSAYSDMAIGLGRIFGFTFLENFNYPYIAASIKEFWRRWHISLSTWFRDYLYIPLGGNRVSKSRLYINLFIVFFITGLWHGASWNFIIWGLIHGAFLIIERLGLGKALPKAWKPLQHMYTLLVVVIAWVFFRADNLAHASDYLKQMFSINRQTNYSILAHYLTFENSVALAMALVLSLPIYPTLRKKLKHLSTGNTIQLAGLNMLRLCTLLILLYISAMYISVDAYNPFIYFRF